MIYWSSNVAWGKDWGACRSTDTIHLFVCLFVFTIGKKKRHTEEMEKGREWGRKDEKKGTWLELTREKKALFYYISVGGT